MGLFSFLRKDKKKKKTVEDFQTLIDLITPKKEIFYDEIKEYHYKRIDGEFIFKVGDKVICRSNEADPLMVAEIVYFWDNDGKWADPIPHVKDSNEKIWGVMGIIRPYSDELYQTLIKLKPLEQWNYFVPKEYQYTEQEMERKELFYQTKLKSLEKFK